VEILDSGENRDDGVHVRVVFLHDVYGGDESGARMEIP